MPLRFLFYFLFSSHVFLIVRSNVCICLRESVNHADVLFVPDFCAPLSRPLVFSICVFVFFAIVCLLAVCVLPLHAIHSSSFMNTHSMTMRSKCATRSAGISIGGGSATLGLAERAAKGRSALAPAPTTLRRNAGANVRVTVACEG